MIRESFLLHETIQALYGQDYYAASAQSADDYRVLAMEQSLFCALQELAQFERVPVWVLCRVVRWAWDDDREIGNIGLENDGKGYVVVISLIN